MTQAHAPIAHVFIHDVEVGSMPLVDYEEILASVRDDWRIRIAGAVESMQWLVGGAAGFARDYVRGVVTVIALSLTYAALAADGADVVAWWQHAAAQEIVGVLKAVSLGALVLLLAVRVVTGRLWSYPVESAYNREVHLRVRRLLEVPSDGPMRITWAEEIPVKSRGISFRDVMNLAKKLGRSPRG
ncbi:hypothetical protein ACTOWA_00370 [Herbaspirillum seropedicae]|uniref:hypothetical protein n=1 Tax=Herbaspirillum seropedicae TaxID=964 RepID=UPI00285CC82F|nr:hypothetical protein [Herbaspirillum seropedicae]MDR6397956.1 hypothetical protein [Herbaspirillum seropedicae]